jgi:hypothetical protein
LSSQLSVVERLRLAAAAVIEAELPAELRSAGLVLAFWAEDHRLAADPARKQLGDPTGASDAIAAKLGVSVDALERIFDFENGDVALILPRRALGASKSAAASELAHLVVAARQTMGLADWTPVEAVRAVCDDMGVLDGNFGRFMQQLNGNGFRVRGAGVKRELKMNASGFEATAALVNRISAGLS